MKNRNSLLDRLLSDRAPLFSFAILIVLVAGLVVDATKAGEEDNFYANIIVLEQVATKIHQNYVEEVKSGDLVDKAVDGMMQILDPHSSFFKKEQYEELLIHTEGQFGGLGIQISIRDRVLTVMTPISGTPASRAGIQSGDQILKINGKSTAGMSIDVAVSKLRGEPGTDVTITIRRRGEPKDADYTITREVIKIKSVPFYGVLDGNIGYARLVTFSQDAGDEVEKAVKELLKKNIKALVLDLRMNPGGLLPQAIEVSEKFLPKKSLVVSTRGRVQGQNKEFYASSNPVLPEDIPLVVLVNSASASASEIVSGAIQDWDRGVIVGDTTFGKGSVQSILPVDKTHHLKLTTAFYYTPSGRCINKPENAVRGAKAGRRGEDEEEGVENDTAAGPDSLAADSAKADTASVAVDTATYKTKKQRLVKGGGGIIPDTVVGEQLPPLVIQALLGRDAFFKFANSEYPRAKQKKSKDGSIAVDDAIMKDFHHFLDSIDFKFQSFAQVRFDEFKTLMGIPDSATDSTGKAAKDKKEAAKGKSGAKADGTTRPAPRSGEPGLDWTPEEKATLKKISGQIDALLVKLGDRALADNEQEIRRYLSEALLVRDLGQDNEIVYRRRLGEDNQLKTAVSILQDKSTYERFLTPVAKK